MLAAGPILDRSVKSGATLPSVDFELPPADDPRRLAVRAWLAEHPTPTGRELAEAGYVAPHWPRPWGLDADPIHQILIDEELAAAGVRRPTNTIGIGWAGPTLLHGGSEEQKERYLFPLLAGEEIWCQLFSEPGSGSDLASLGTRAVRDGDEWVVNGQKIWTSLAQFSQVRHPHRPHRAGRAEARGDLVLHLPDGRARHRDPADHRDDRLAHVQRGVLRRRAAAGREPRRRREPRAGGSPRSPSATSGCRCRPAGRCGGWARPPTTSSTSCGRPAAPTTRCCASGSRALHIEHELLRLIRLRTVTARIKGEPPGAEASVRKILADEHGQAIMGLAKDLAGPGGMLTDHGPLGGARRPVALRLPVLARAHRGRRHRRGAAQHRRRAGAGPAPRHRRRAGPDLEREPPLSLSGPGRPPRATGRR